MKWSILILTCPGRERWLKRLVDMLEPQIAEFTDVEIVTHSDNRNWDRGGNRKHLIEQARGEYVCFVDDDDLVAMDYVSRIRPLLDGVDYIGFQVQAFMDGHKFGQTFHSLRFPTWFNDDHGYYRDLSHVNPIKKELALQGVFKGTGNEDVIWADSMRNLGIVKTEHYIPRVMYFYFIRTTKNDAHDIPMPAKEALAALA